MLQKSRELSKKVVRRMVSSPIEAIVVCASTFLVLYCLYYALPISLDTTGVINEVFGSQQEHIVIAMMISFPAVLNLYAFISSDRQRFIASILYVGISFAFLTYLRILAIGFLPPGGWMLFLFPTVVCSISYLALKVNKQ